MRYSPVNATTELSAETADTVLGVDELDSAVVYAPGEIAADRQSWTDRVECADHPMSIRTRREPWLLLLPAIVLLALGFVTPVAGMLLMSVQSPAGGFGLENFTRLFTSEYHLEAAWRSLRLGSSRPYVTLALAFPLSYIMARTGSRTRSLLLMVIILPLMTSVVVRTFGWVVLMGPTGLLMKIPGLDMLVRGTQGFLGTEAGIVIAMVQVLLPFAVLSILSVMGGISTQTRRGLSHSGGRILAHAAARRTASLGPGDCRRSNLGLRALRELIHHSAVHRRFTDPGIRTDDLHRCYDESQLAVRGRAGRAAVRRRHVRPRRDVALGKQKV